ncbi:hypothetical protein NBRC116597_05970 [Phaeobacter sp. NW0010-22]
MPIPNDHIGMQGVGGICDSVGGVFKDLVAGFLDIGRKKAEETDPPDNHYEQK